ncbi:hypothetical protein BGW38_001191, partial [Lunasporangiospora selenospora]
MASLTKIVRTWPTNRFSTPQTTISPDFNDRNFETLAKDVEKMYAAAVNEEQGDQFEIDMKVKGRARERVELEILAQQLLLQLLINHILHLEPRQSFLEQTTTKGASTIDTLFNTLQKYDASSIGILLKATQTKLHRHLKSRQLGLVISVDEAQIAENDTLAGNLISPSALTGNYKNKGAILDDKNQTSGMQATIVILGTALSLQNVDNVYSGIDKTENFTRITDFPQFDANEVNKMISDLVDLSGCEILPAKRRKLSGRARFSLGIINCLIVPETQLSKQVALDSAIDRTIEHERYGLRNRVRAILARDCTGEAARFLSRMALAYHLQNAKIWFSSQQQLDFVDKALCKMRRRPDGVHLIMDEPIVVDAVEELKAPGKDPAFTENLDELYQVVSNFGVASTYAGSLAIKFYNSPMPHNLYKYNETSSDIRACFLRADGEINKSLVYIRSNIKGILRIHLEFPGVEGGMPATHVRADPMTGIEDVMVYFNLLNMDDLFFEGIAGHEGDIVKLKKAVRF